MRYLRPAAAISAGATAPQEFNWLLGPSAFCNSTNSPKVVGEQPVAAQTLFETRNPCWSSGLWLEKDRKYRIWIEVKDPWFDRSIMTGVNGFQFSRFILYVPFRRWIQAAWFQPVARIGENADGEQPLQDIDGTPPDNLPRPRDLTDRDKKQTYPIHLEDSEPKRNWLKFGLFEPIPHNDLLAAREVWHQQGLSARMVATSRRRPPASCSSTSTTPSSFYRSGVHSIGTTTTTAAARK